jgi:hypothetical protein
MLREWKQYGIEDIRLDKANNIIHGRVGESNCTSPSQALSLRAF